MSDDLKWECLFRDGTYMSGDSITSEGIQQVDDYITGTPTNPKRHFLLWFLIKDGEDEYRVSFDNDGDAYIQLPDEHIVMTEFKIRSADLVLESVNGVVQLGFVGVNTCDTFDGKTVVLKNW